METPWYSKVTAEDMKKKSFQKLYKIMIQDWDTEDDAVSGEGVRLAIKYLKESGKDMEKMKEIMVVLDFLLRYSLNFHLANMM